MTKEIEIQEWIAAGYKKYDDRWNSADFLLQKCIRDEEGKKYFIDVFVYEHHTKEYFSKYEFMQRVGYSPQVQFQNLADNRPVVEMHLLIHEHSIENIEEEFERMWEFLGKPYYERWD